MKRDLLSWTNVYETMWMLYATALCLWRFINFGWVKNFRQLAVGKTKHNSPGRGGCTRKLLQQKLLSFLIHGWPFTSRALHGACSIGISICFYNIWKTKYFIWKQLDCSLFTLPFLCFLRINGVRMIEESFEISLEGSWAGDTLQMSLIAHS